MNSSLNFNGRVDTTNSSFSKVKSITRHDLQFMKRILIKAGTGVVTQEDGSISLGRVGNIIEQISILMKQGKEVIMVTSGSVGLGRKKLQHQNVLSSTMRTQLHGKQELIDEKQNIIQRACAAAGQNGLMTLYDIMFTEKDIAIAQILLTDEDFNHKESRRHFRATIEYLLSKGIIPILNGYKLVYESQYFNQMFQIENDVMSRRKTPIRDENNAIFWDNDSLSALVASETNVDLMILLTDVEGLYKVPPVATEKPQIIHTYFPDAQVNIGSKSRVGRGGMQAKIEACLNAIKNNVRAVLIISGYVPDTILKAVNGEVIGTLFAQNPTRDEADDIVSIAKQKREAGRKLQQFNFAIRQKIITTVAQHIWDQRMSILQANKKDILKAKSSNLNPTLIARLVLDETKLKVLVEGMKQIANQEDSIYKLLSKTELSDGLILEKRTCPLGVILVIFESRPDVLPQIAALAIHSGNALLLKGGKEAKHSIRTFYNIIVEAISSCTQNQLGRDLIALIESRDAVTQLLHMNKEIDLIVPRGSSQLVKYIQSNTQIPVLAHAEGICHIYIDKFAELEKAKNIIIDAKTQYPSACNSVETVLIHQEFLHQDKLQFLLNEWQKSGIKIHAGPSLHLHYPSFPLVQTFSKEYSDLNMAVELVSDLEQAIQHINTYSSSHTDVIITENSENASQFLKQVDSSSVFHNASTRFADGYRYGLGAELGISTSRIHARGPVGVEGLLTTKYTLVSSKGHTVSEFLLGKSNFTHRNLLAKM